MTDRPKDRAELDTLCKARSGQLPEWGGVLWARDPGAADGSSQIGPPEIGGNSRSLGRVLVAGDERLIRRVEDAHRRRAGGWRGR